MGEEEFRNYLREELLRRCRENPLYSLRAFARFLNVDPSSLSQMLRKKRKISQKSIVTLSSRLGLGVPNLLNNNLSVQRTSQGVQKDISSDALKVLSDWSHFAITQYLRIPKAPKNEYGIALSLSLSIHEVRQALERLQRLEMLTKNADGTWRVHSSEVLTSSNESTNTAFRQMQKQILEKALRALDEVEYEYRGQSSACMPANPTRLPQAKEKIKAFRRELASFLGEGDCTELYQLNVSLFPLTHFYRQNRSS